MKRPLEVGPGESSEGENPIPAQPTKLRSEVRSSSIVTDADKNKAKESVEDSSTTPLKKVEGAEDIQTELQLDEKNDIPAWLKKDIPPKGPLIAEPYSVSLYSCGICTKSGHRLITCPWRNRIPHGVTKVGKGYGIDEKHRRVYRLHCVHCGEYGHEIPDCSDWNKLLEECGGDVPLPSCLLVDE